jgi:hypothetical protein
MRYTLEIREQHNSQDKWPANYSTQHLDFLLQTLNLPFNLYLVSTTLKKS